MRSSVIVAMVLAACVYAEEERDPLAPSVKPPAPPPGMFDSKSKPPSVAPESKPQPAPLVAETKPVTSPEIDMKALLKQGAEEKKDTIAALKVLAEHNPSANATIAEVQKMKDFLPRLKFADGSIGVLKIIHTQSHIDGRDGRVGTAFLGFNDCATVFQVVDDNNVIIEWNGEKVWAETPTNGLVDGKWVSFPGLYKFAGTKRYQTAMGSSLTVRKITKLADK